MDELVLEGRLLATVDDFYQTWAVEALKKGFDYAARQPGGRNAGGWSVTPHKLVTRESLSALSAPAAQ